MRAHAMTFIILLATSFPAMAATSFTWGIREDLVYFRKQALAFKADIEKQTKQRVKINIVTYPESDEDGLAATAFIVQKKYDMVQDLVNKFESTNAEFRVWNLPFLFSTYEQLESYMAGLGESALQKLETEQLLPVAYSYSGGFLMIHGARLDRFKDLVGKSLVVEEEYSTYEQSLKKRKITPVRDRSNDSKYVEQIVAVGDEVTVKNDISETVVNLTDHRVFSRIIFANKKKLSQLSGSDRKLFVAKLKDYAHLERLDSIEGQNLIIELLKNRGAVINKWTSQQRAQGRKFFAPEYKQFEADFPGYIKKIDGLSTKLLTRSN